MSDSETPRLPRERRDYRHPVPEGCCTFDLSLGRSRVRLVDLPTAWTPFVEEHYAPFALPPGDDSTPDLVIVCREEGPRTVVPLPPPDEITVIDVQSTGRRAFRLRSHWQDGWFDLEAGRGELVLTDRLWDRFAMSVENFLRVALQLLAVENGSFLLHGAGILEDAHCHFFFGPSGAGKSTATAFSMPREALSDDMVLIDVSGEEPFACAVPFFMVYPAEKRLKGEFPIRGAFRLRQDSEDRLSRLGLARAVATVSASVPFVHELGIPHTGLTELVGRFASRVPVYDLHFTKSARFWDLIRAL